MVSVVLFGNVEPQTSAVQRLLRETCDVRWIRRVESTWKTLHWVPQPFLIVVAGWRHLLPPEVLETATLGAVGFHSAKLPEYPGRAPVPWTLLRGDRLAYNTMLYLDEGVDSGDIIDQRARVVLDDDTPETLYEWMAKSCVDMLRQHLPALLDGTAPRYSQDLTKRGPLTTADGWKRWQASQS